jgi:fructose-1,6-bisphosphatase I
MIALDERLQLLKAEQPERAALIELFTALAAKAKEVSRIIAAGGDLGSTIGDQNADGDAQKALDVMADDAFLTRRSCPAWSPPTAVKNRITR